MRASIDELTIMPCAPGRHHHQAQPTYVVGKQVMSTTHFSAGRAALASKSRSFVETSGSSSLSLFRYRRIISWHFQIAKPFDQSDKCLRRCLFETTGNSYFFQDSRTALGRFERYKRGTKLLDLGR